MTTKVGEKTKPSLWASLEAGQTDLSPTWSHTSEDRSSRDVAQSNLYCRASYKLWSHTGDH